MSEQSEIGSQFANVAVGGAITTAAVTAGVVIASTSGMLASLPVILAAGPAAMVAVHLMEKKTPVRLIPFFAGALAGCALGTVVGKASAAPEAAAVTAEYQVQTSRPILNLAAKSVVRFQV